MNDQPNTAPRFYVIVRGGEHDGKSFEVLEGGLTIGRATSCDIVLSDKTISRLHARIYVNNGFCFAEDVGSRNGLLISGKRQKKRCLRKGDVIDLGVCKLDYHEEGAQRERSVSAELEEQTEKLRELSARPPIVEELPALPIHPFAIAGAVFAALALAYWAFAIGALILSGLAIFQIRRYAEHRGMVLAVIAAVAGITAGMLNGCIRGAISVSPYEDTPITRECKANLNAIGQVLKQYAESHGGKYPASLQDLTPQYISDKDTLSCPGCLAKGEPEAACRYVFSASSADSKTLAPDDIIVYDGAASNHDGRGGFALRASGKVVWLGAKGLELRLAEPVKEGSR